MAQQYGAIIVLVAMAIRHRMGKPAGHLKVVLLIYTTRLKMAIGMQII